MNYLEGYIGISTNRYFCINTTICHTDTPYRQDPHLGEDKGGLSGPKKDRYKVWSLLDKAHLNFWVQAAQDSQFCQALY